MAEHDKEITFAPNRRKILVVLLLVCILTEIALVLLDAFVNYARMTELGMVRRFFNIAREDSLPSWLGVTQTFLVALTLWTIYLIKRKTEVRRFRRAGWLVLALFFTFMAMDDGAEFHERMGSAFKKIHKEQAASETPKSIGAKVLKAFPSYPWQFLFLPFFGAIAIFMCFFLWTELERPWGIGLIGAALGCFVLAVGLDFIEGLDTKHPLNAHERIRAAYELTRYDVRHFSKSIEEFLEMLGTTFFWVAFLAYLMRTPQTIRLDFSKN